MRATLALGAVALALAPTALADAVYHSAHIALTPVGVSPLPLRSGFVENIHPNGPNVFAHEEYVLNGAVPNTTYTVTIHIAGSADTTCAAPFVNLDTATLTTNAAGNGSASKVFTPADVGGLANSTIHAYWTVSSGDTVAYATSCQTITLDS
jgi:hypothetical protein